jgi:hypothetical protein
MGVSYQECEDKIEAAAEELFDKDSRVRAVGISRHDGEYGFRAIRNSQAIAPLNAGLPPIQGFEGVPVVYRDTFGEVESLVMVPGTPGSPVSPSATSVIPEVNRHRPLVGGLQIQNFDDDDRQGLFAQGFIIIGTLGCFVRLDNGDPALLSNNHVVAGENRGQKGSDRILQPGSTVHDPNEQIDVLTDFVGLLPSPAGATPRTGNVTFNEIDAGVAKLDENITFNQGYLPLRNLIVPSATATARIGDQVFKVGRTTGLTQGEVTDVATVVGPVPYDPGPCWFRRSITIEGLNGTQFSDKGDSGSAIVRTNGQIIGILYAGNGAQTFACPIDTCLQNLSCTLA